MELAPGICMCSECCTCKAAPDSKRWPRPHVRATFARFNVLPRKRVITQKQESRLEEMIGEELGHKWAVEISLRFMRVSLQFIAAFSSS